MAELMDQDRRVLLRVARSAIESALIPGTTAERPDTLGPALNEKRGCFVTLHKGGCLRGCIGCIEAKTPLIDGVEENALNAAFRDPRFPPLSKEELSGIDLEVSVLTRPEPLAFSDAQDLRSKLIPGIHGVILSRGWHRATFLPQVWKQLPNMEDFLGNLCMKAGMDRRCWMDPKISVKVYQAEYFSESCSPGNPNPRGTD